MCFFYILIQTQIQSLVGHKPEEYFQNIKEELVRWNPKCFHVSFFIIILLYSSINAVRSHHLSFKRSKQNWQIL